MACVVVVFYLFAEFENVLATKLNLIRQKKKNEDVEFLSFFSFKILTCIVIKITCEMTKLLCLIAFWPD